VNTKKHEGISIQEDEDLGIRSDVPLIERFRPLGGLILAILDFGAIENVGGILLILIIGIKLFSLSGSAMLSVLVFLALLIAKWFWALIGEVSLDRFMGALFFEGPVFGKLGGPARRTFFTALKASDEIQIEFEADDARKAKDFVELMTELQEEELKLAYREKVYEPKYGVGDGAEFESKWTSVWEDQVLELRTGDIKFKDALINPNMAYLVVSSEMHRTSVRMVRLILLFQVIILYLTTMLLNDRIQFLLVIQIGVFISFMCALLWYTAYSFSLGKISAPINIYAIHETVRSKFRNAFESFIGTDFRLKKLRVKPKFYGLMRGFQIRLILASLWTSITGLVLIGASLLISRVRFAVELDDWYASLALALLVSPFFLIVGFYLISVILQYSRKVVAPLVAGLVAAALPYAIDYAITGEFQLDGVENAVSSIFAGVGILLTTVVTNHIQKSLEGEE
jgi:hypothetical protein